MADKIIRAYWDCPQCGMKGIDGLKDTCPGCGSGKDKNVRYYMKNVEEVSQEELEEAGISEDENDGAHREWVCAYCGFLNNYRDTACVRCGAPKEEQEGEYAGDTSQAQYVQNSDGTLHFVGKPKEEEKPSYVTMEQAAASGMGPGGGSGTAPSRSGRGGRGILLIVAALLALFLLWPHTTSQAITGFAWERSVTVEEFRTFQESGWSLPYGARQLDARREFYGYQQVLDHYETVYRTREREVIDHYDTSYTYTDNGNGTFTQHEVKTPVYRTETYQVAEKEPVYRNEPVYRTKYYYETDRWVMLQEYKTSGEDHDPQWSSEYTLKSNQRDTMRSEWYYTIYSDSEKRFEPYETWASQEIGDGVYVTRNRLGIEYSRKEKG